MRPRPVQHLEYFTLAGLLFVAYVVFFNGLGGIGLLGPDEPRYAGVAREMYVSGDYITPRLLGEAWFEKPPLLYWLAALGYAAFGVGEVGARLPSALAATASVLLIYWCGRSVWNRRVGVTAALILATSVGFLGLGRAASTDMLLTSSLNAALALFLVGTQSDVGERRARACLYGFYAALGVGVLAKGPVALFLPLLSLGVFLAWRGRPGEWKRWRLEGILVTVLVAAPWYLAVWWLNGWIFVEEFLLNHNLLRFTSDLYEHQQPFYYFVPVALAMMFPWSFFLLPALGRRRFDKNECLVLVWAVVPFIFFSFSGSKLPAYILPIAAPIALLCAHEFGSRETRSRAFGPAVVLQALSWAGLGAVLAFFPALIGLDVPVGDTALSAGLAVVALGVLVIGLWRQPTTFVAYNVGLFLVLVVLITSVVFPRTQSIQSMRPWREVLGRLATEDEEVILYKPVRWMEYGLEFYRQRDVRAVLSEPELAEIASSGSRILCIAPNDVLDELSSGNSVAIDVVSSVGNQTAFWIYQP